MSADATSVRVRFAAMLQSPAVAVVATVPVGPHKYAVMPRDTLSSDVVLLVEELVVLVAVALPVNERVLTLSNRPVTPKAESRKST